MFLTKSNLALFVCLIFASWQLGNARRLIMRSGLELPRFKRSSIGLEKFTLQTNADTPVVKSKTFNSRNDQEIFVVYVFRENDKGEPKPPNYSATILYRNYNSVTIRFEGYPNEDEENIEFEVELINFS